MAFKQINCIVVLVAPLCPTLCNLMDCNLLGSSSMKFSRQEYWSGLLCPSPGDLPDPEVRCLTNLLLRVTCFSSFAFTAQMAKGCYKLNTFSCRLLAILQVLKSRRIFNLQFTPSKKEFFRWIHLNVWQNHYNIVISLQLK